MVRTKEAQRTKEKARPVTKPKEPQGRKLVDQSIKDCGRTGNAHYGDPVMVGNKPLKLEDETIVQHGIYLGISKEADGAKFRIVFPASLNGVMGDIYADNQDVGEREAKRYVAEKLKIGCSPKAVVL